MRPSLPRRSREPNPSQVIATLAALALAACGGDAAPGRTQVVMSLDPETCTATSPDAIEVRCAATAGVWLRRGDGSATLDQACVALGEGGAARSLGELSNLLGDIDLVTTSSDPVSIEVAVYGAWSPSDGCVAPDALEAVDDPPEILVRGASGAVSLADEPRTIEVVLRCESVSTPPAAAMCQAMCRPELDACLAQEHIDACFAELEDCRDPCKDDACVDACEDEYGDCLGESVDGRCELGFETCAEDCQDDPCFDTCEDEFSVCIGVTCDAANDQCVSTCTDDPSCAVVVSP